MVVALDESGMDDLPVPIVVQEYCNHGALLFKVRSITTSKTSAGGGGEEESTYACVQLM